MIDQDLHAGAAHRMVSRDEWLEARRALSRWTAEALATRALLLALVLNLAGQAQAQAQESKTPYPHMAPAAQYAMADQNAEIAMARSAAPASVSRDATILVLGQHGYETAAKGSNGFVCVVERSWMSPFDFPEFWNPRLRGPICFNPPAVRSVLPFTYKRTEMVLAGMSKTQMVARLKQVIESKEIPALEPGAMSYMMSKEGHLNDSVGHWHPHLMFYGPRSTGADWGADFPGSPVLLNPQFQDSPEPLATVMVRVFQWSDGTPALVHAH
jgi:hypothetical protein